MSRVVSRSVKVPFFLGSVASRSRLLAPLQLLYLFVCEVFVELRRSVGVESDNDGFVNGLDRERKLYRV